MKTCTKCHESKPESAYYRKARAHDGLQPACKVCHDAMSADWRARNVERCRENTRAWKQAHIETVRAQRRTATKVARKRDPDKAKARRLVEYYISKGTIPAVHTQTCAVCGVAQASDWHHHNGYSAEHKLDVIPVCRTCHVSIHNK